MEKYQKSIFFALLFSGAFSFLGLYWGAKSGNQWMIFSLFLLVMISSLAGAKFWGPKMSNPGVGNVAKEKTMKMEFDKLKTNLRFVLESVDVGIVYMDTNWIIRTYNKAAAKLLGRPEQLALNKPVTEALARMPVERKLLIRTLQGKKEYKNYLFQRPVGEQERELMIDTYLVSKNNGQIIGSAMFIKDVTEQRKMQREIERFDALSLLGKLAAGTAHEIKNPLTAMRGTLQMMQWRLEGKPELEKELNYIGLLLEEIDRINQVVQEFLLLSRVNSPKRKELDLNKLIVDLLAILENQAIARSIKIETLLEESLLGIEGDGEKIKQVVLNLAQNAFQAMSSGGTLQITTNSLPRLKQIMLQIKDEGCGIDSQNLEKIFEYFYTTKEEGTGLGLPICQQIIHDHGGSIEVESQLGAGTIFTIFLPAKRESSGLS